MTVPSETSRIVYDCDGSTTVFPYTFLIFEDSDLTVTKVLISDNSETELVLNTDYSVSGAGDPAGGDVTLLIAAPSSDYKLIIERMLPITQETDYTLHDDFSAETIEEDFDRLIMICQQLQSQLEREILTNLPVIVPGYLYYDGVSLTCVDEPTDTSYAGTISHGADANKAASPTAGDIYIATDTSKIYICYTAGTWTEVPSINTATAKTSLADGDVFLLEDSAASYAKKKITRANLKTDLTDACVKLTGNQTVAGIKTFSSFPVTPSSAPTSNYQTANKKYVDDMNSAVVDNQSGSGDIATKVTIASVTISTTAGKKVILLGFAIVPPISSGDLTVTLWLYRDTTSLLTFSFALPDSDNANAAEVAPIMFIDEDAGTGSTVYTLQAQKAGFAGALNATGYLSVCEVK